VPADHEPAGHPLTVAVEPWLTLARVGAAVARGGIAVIAVLAHAPDAVPADVVCGVPAADVHAVAVPAVGGATHGRIRRTVSVCWDARRFDVALGDGAGRRATAPHRRA